MILLFLGSWRSTFIIALSIPLSVLCSIATLSALGETINLMTLGGLALAVGILVDDATVAIENIHRHMAEGKPLEDAILDRLAGNRAAGVCLDPVHLHCVRADVFPDRRGKISVHPAGGSRGVRDARQLYPFPYAGADAGDVVLPQCPVARGTQRRIWKLRGGCGLSPVFNVPLNPALTVSVPVTGPCSPVVLSIASHLPSVFLAFCAASWLLTQTLGQDFFPAVDAGQFLLHLRARTGTRIEETERLTDQVNQVIHSEIPARELGGILDNIGIPNSSINLSYNTSGVIGPGDADMLVSLKPGHAPTENHVRRLRERLNREFPGTLFYFLPADIVSQTLNFGLPAPFDVQIVGRDQAEEPRHGRAPGRPDQKNSRRRRRAGAAAGQLAAIPNYG